MADTKNKKVSIEVEVKTDNVRQKLDDFKRSVNSLNNKINITVNANTRNADKALNDLRKNSERASKKMAQHFSGSFDTTAKKIKNITKNIVASLETISKEGRSIGEKFGISFVNAAVKAIRSRIGLFKSTIKLIISGIASVIKGCLPMITSALRFLSNAITKSFSNITNTAKRTIGNIGNLLSRSLKKTVDFTINANVNTSNSGSAVSQGAAGGMLSASLVASSLKTITRAASDVLPTETGNVAAAFASKLIDAGQKALIFGKFAFQAYVLIKNNWSKIVETFKSVTSTIKPYLESGLKSAIDAAKNVLKTGMNNLIDTMKNSDNPYIRKLGEITNNIVNKLKALKEPLENFKNKLKPTAESISKAFNTIKNVIGKIVESVKNIAKAFEPLKDAIKPLIGYFKSFGGPLKETVRLVGNVVNILSPLLGLLGPILDLLSAINGLRASILGVINDFIEAISDVAKKVVEFLVKPFKWVAEKVTDFINVISLGISNLPNLFSKLANVLKSACERIANAAKTLWQRVKDWWNGPSDGSSYGSSNGTSSDDIYVGKGTYNKSSSSNSSYSSSSGGPSLDGFIKNAERIEKDINAAVGNSKKLRDVYNDAFGELFEELNFGTLDDFVKNAKAGKLPNIIDEVEKAIFDMVDDSISDRDKHSIALIMSSYLEDIVIEYMRAVADETSKQAKPKGYSNNAGKGSMPGGYRQPSTGTSSSPEVKVNVDTESVDEQVEETLKGKITSIADAIEAYQQFEQQANAVLHPVKTLKEALAAKMVSSWLSDSKKLLEKMKVDFDKLKESVKAFKNAGSGTEKFNAGLQVLSNSAKVAIDRLKLVLKTNTVGKLIEKMKGPAEKATKKLADKVPGGKDNINLFKGALSKLALLFGGAGLFGLTREATQQAYAYESAIMQLNNRLGKSAALFEEFAKGKGLDLGLDRASITQYGNTFSIFVSKFESDANKATETTISLLEAASKTAQATGQDMTTVMDSFRSALTGSSEAVDQYGLNMKVANLELSESFKQIANGASKWEELTQAQQQQVIAMEMIRQTNENFGEGVKNSNSIMLKFQATLNNVKLALGNTFKVILTAVLPPLTALLKTLEVVLNKVTEFVTTLLSLMNIEVSFTNGLGQISNLNSGIEDTSSSVDDIASSADSATESAKKLKGELAGFDEINKITMSEETGSGEGLNSEGINAGEIQLETNDADNKITQFANKAKEILDTIMETFKSGWDKNVPYIQESLEKLKAAFEHVKEASKDLFKGIWENGGSELLANIGSLCSAVAGMSIDMAGQIMESIAQVFEHLNPANNKAMQYFIDSLNGMVKAAEEFVLSIGEHFASWREHGLQDFFNNIADIGVALAGLAADLGGQVLTALDNFLDHIDPASNPRTQKFLEALNYMAQAVEDFILDIGGWFSSFMENGGQAFLNNLGDIALAIGQLAATLVGDIINGVRDFMNSWAGEALINAVAKALEWVSGAIEAVIGYLADHPGIVETFLGVWGAYEGGKKVVEWYNNISTFIGTVKDLAVALGGGVLTSLKKLFDLFTTSGLSGTIKAIAGAIGDLVKNIIASTAALVKNIAQWIAQKAALIAGKVATVAMQVAQAALNVVMTANPIGLVVAAIAALVAAFVLAYNKCDWFREGVDKAIKWIKDAFSAFVTWIKEAFNKIWTAITGVFDKCKPFFQGVVNGIKSVFSGIVSFISNPFKSAYEVIKGVVEKIKNVFNFNWSLPKIKMPHFSIKPSGWQIGDLLDGTIPRLGIEWYSKGGIFNERALIGVGDANNGFGNKPEAVVPLDQMYKNISKIIHNEISSNNRHINQIQNQGNTTVILKVNDVELAKTVIKSINSLQRSTGEVLLDI